MTQIKPIEDEDVVISLEKIKYEEFCNQIRKYTKSFKLDIFKEKNFVQSVINISKKIFFDEIRILSDFVNDVNVGISALDIPDSDNLEDAMNSVMGVAVALGVFNNIGKSIIDPMNLTPFTLHTASHTNAGLLSSTEHTPEAKLGYHNDGLLNGEVLELPETIMLYNLYLGYREPGCFKWIPTALWEDREYFLNKTKDANRLIKMKLTPYFNVTDNSDMQTTEFNDIEIAISSIASSGERRFFLNGKLTPHVNLQENIDLVEMIKLSLERNPVQFNIGQKERRVIFIKNTNGFHARDIFKEAIDGVDLTRVFLRSVDVNADRYPSSKICSKEVKVANFYT